MLHSGDFSAWVTVDEGELTQYSVDSENKKQVTCWIPSATDKVWTEFKLQYLNMNDYP